jgi:hypothetical protein
VSRDYQAINRFGKPPLARLSEAERRAGFKICRQCYYDGRPYVHPIKDFQVHIHEEEGYSKGSPYHLCRSCWRARRKFESERKLFLIRQMKKEVHKKDLEENGYYDEQGNPRHDLFKEKP